MGQRLGQRMGQRMGLSMCLSMCLSMGQWLIHYGLVVQGLRPRGCPPMIPEICDGTTTPVTRLAVMPRPA